jgi:hypothetical protein
VGEKVFVASELDVSGWFIGRTSRGGVGWGGGVEMVQYVRAEVMVPATSGERRWDEEREVRTDCRNASPL